jgi:hypothetical protein
MGIEQVILVLLLQHVQTLLYVKNWLVELLARLQPDNVV